MPGKFKGKIGAVILAAGQSRRMGKPKLILPWGNRTVIEQVVSTLRQAGIDDILLVTGGSREQVEQALVDYKVSFAYNEKYETHEMLTSLQAGILASDPALNALLVVLGDQPAIRSEVFESIVEKYYQEPTSLIIPSYRMRRGHPWLVDKRLWDELLEMPAEKTLRDFLVAHNQDITYVVVDTPTILSDIDTPDDYESQRPDS